MVHYDKGVRKKLGFTLSERQKTKESPYQDVWNCLSLNHYFVANTSIELLNQLDSGLLFPALIFPNDELGLSISSQSTWSRQTMERLLDEILRYNNALIKVQDHSIPQLSHFITATTTWEVVHDCFRLNPEERGCPWNRLEISNFLPGFKGSKGQNHWNMEAALKIGNLQIQKPSARIGWHMH